MSWADGVSSVAASVGEAAAGATPDGIDAITASIISVAISSSSERSKNICQIKDDMKAIG